MARVHTCDGASTETSGRLTFTATRPVEALLFGLAIVASAFLLAWGAEAAQVDWGEFGDVFGIGRPVHAFVLVLCYSRLLTVTFTFSQTLFQGGKVGAGIAGARAYEDLADELIESMRARDQLPALPAIVAAPGLPAAVHVTPTAVSTIPSTTTAVTAPTAMTTAITTTGPNTNGTNTNGAHEAAPGHPTEQTHGA